MTRPATITTLVVLPSVALLIGSVLRNPAAALGAPVAVAALIVLAAWAGADREAERDFWGSVAQRLGFRFTFETDLLPLTPLLGAGDRRGFEHTLKGPLGETGLVVRLAHYRYETDDTDSDGDRTSTTHRFTVCIVDIEPGMRLFPGVYVRARRGPLGRGRHDWLRTRRLCKVELESTGFNQAYDLLITAEQDPVRLRELFDPKTVLWFAEHPLRPHIEFRAGTLVVYVPEHVEDIGRLVWLLDATARIAGRVLEEITETVTVKPM